MKKKLLSICVILSATLLFGCGKEKRSYLITPETNAEFSGEIDEYSSQAEALRKAQEEYETMLTGLAEKQAELEKAIAELTTTPLADPVISNTPADGENNTDTPEDPDNPDKQGTGYPDDPNNPDKQGGDGQENPDNPGGSDNPDGDGRENPDNPGGSGNPDGDGQGGNTGSPGGGNGTQNTPTTAPTNTPVVTIPPATNTPVPTATNTPVPTATNTPVPTATNTPVPTATNTPKPTATNTPKPTEAADEIVTPVANPISSELYQRAQALVEKNYDKLQKAEGLVNKIRKANGAPAIKFDRNLCIAATMRALEMRDAAADYQPEKTGAALSHTRPDGSKCYTAIKDAGYSIDNNWMGENIAWGFNQMFEVKEAVSAWENSPDHFRNIVNSNFTLMGVGCCEHDDGVIFWAQEFYTP